MRKMTPNRLVIVCLLSAAAASCGANEGVLHSGKQSPAPPANESRVEPFEQDLADVKAANFTWLYVIRRRDGGILDAEDKAFLRKGTAESNRRVVSDGGKAVIVGSNYEASVAGVETLKARFDVTDLSTGRPEATLQPPG
jgi:hypothetical protein